MNTLLMLSLIPLVFIAMYFIQKSNKSLHLLVVGVAVAWLFVNHFYQTEHNQDSFVVLLCLIYFGNVWKEYRKAS